MSRNAGFDVQPAGNASPTPNPKEESMESTDCPITVSLLFGAPVADVLAGFTTVWLHGVHDRSIAGALSAAIQRASDIDEADVMVDFSGASSVDAETFDALIVSGCLLYRRSLSLRARSPNPAVQSFALAHRFAWLFDNEGKRSAEGVSVAEPLCNSARIRA